MNLCSCVFSSDVPALLDKPKAWLAENCTSVPTDTSALAKSPGALADALALAEFLILSLKAKFAFEVVSSTTVFLYVKLASMGSSPLFSNSVDLCAIQ